MGTIIQPGTRHGKRGPYRHHTVEFKRAIVVQSLLPDASVSRVAREHNVNANQVFAWRKLFREGQLGKADGDSVKLLPVVLAGASADLPNRDPEPVSSDGQITLVIGEVQLRIDGKVDAAALALVLDRLLS